MSGSVVWIHEDSSGNVQSQIDQARSVARANAWQDTPEHRALFRAWQIGMWATITSLGPKPIARIEGEANPLGGGVVLPAGDKYLVQPALATAPFEASVQARLSTAYNALAGIASGRSQANAATVTGEMGSVVLRTVDGQPATFETAIAPMIAALVVVAVAGVGAWAISVLAEYEQNKLVSETKERELMAAMTRSADVVDAHQGKDEQAGRSTPYDAGELAELDALGKAIQATAGWTPPALKSVPNVAGMSDAAKGAIAGAGSGLAWALAAFVAYVGYKALK